jgi:CheY-like chemotaxis protein
VSNEVSSQSWSRHILCVDDDLAELQLRRKLLEAEGYTVTVARSPSLALDLDTSRFALAILDFHMREMNGLQLLLRLRQRHAAYPVVLLSHRIANLSPDTTVLFSVCLEKSGPSRVLLDAIRVFLNPEALPDFPPRQTETRDYIRHELQLFLHAKKHSHLLQEID